MLAFPPDVTFLIQLGSFFVLLFFLNRLLFRPYMDLLVERESRTSGDQDLARDQVAETEQLKARMKAELTETRAQAHEVLEGIRRSTKEEESRLFDEARSLAGERLAVLRAEIDQARIKARQTLVGETERIAGQMVEGVLGRRD